MFKKLLLLALVVMLASPVFAGQDVNKVIDNKTFSHRGTTHELTSTARYIGDAKRVSFFVTYNPTRDGVSAAVTFEASLEGVTWGQVFPEYGSVTDPLYISTTKTYVFSLPGDYALPQIRIGVKSPNDNSYISTDISRITVTIVEQK